jgi:CO/xanthine dehydrogenase Mo-binding subunit
MRQAYRYIGKSVPRRDAVDIVTGQSKFLDDNHFDNLLYGKALRSPHPHAIIKKIDLSKAEKLEGVKAILTWETVPDWKYGNPPISRVLDRKVRYVGDAVALVAAESPEIADEAKRLIEVEYEILPAVFDDHEALKPGAPQLYDELPGNVLPISEPIIGPMITEIVMGDVEKGFAEADVIVEGKCGYDGLPNPMPMESPGVVAFWDASNRVTMWVSNQTVHLSKLLLNIIFGREVDVRAIGGPCGGSFGSKLMTVQIHCYAAALSKVTGRPVKVILSKEEHLATFVLRPASRLDLKVGMKKDGTVTALDGSWLVGTGYYSLTTQAQVAVGCGEAMIAVRCKNWNVKPAIVCTNRNASGIVRGFGGQELKCALFPILSRAMAKLDLDPLDFIKKNFIKPGEGYFWRNGRWYDYRGIDFTPTMEKGAETFGWKEKWKGWLNPSRVNGTKRIGVGVGIHGNADIGEDISEAYVRLSDDGKVTLYSSLAEHGTGQRSNAIKVAAEVLQVPIEHVFITPSDTLVTPFEFGTVGSRGTYAVLSAVINAAENARDKLLTLAAPLLDVAAGDLDTADGLIWVKATPEKRVPWQQVLFMCSVMGYGRFEADYSLSNCMVSFVEVAVDTETGKIDLLRVVNATDVGTVIDPQGLEAQLNGCLGTAGIDSALFEETILDPSTGRILNANMIDYKWRTCAELPKIDNVVLETPISSHRFHAVGVGEITTSPGPSAIFMAASNAVGTWLESYPVTPEKILNALGKIKGSGKRGAR